MLLFTRQQFSAWIFFCAPRIFLEQFSRVRFFPHPRALLPGRWSRNYDVAGLYLRERVYEECARDGRKGYYLEVSLPSEYETRQKRRPTLLVDFPFLTRALYESRECCCRWEMWRSGADFIISRECGSDDARGGGGIYSSTLHRFSEKRGGNHRARRPRCVVRHSYIHCASATIKPPIAAKEVRAPDESDGHYDISQTAFHIFIYVYQLSALDPSDVSRLGYSHK